MIAATRAGRRRAEALMVDACIVTDPATATAPSWNDETGQWETPDAAPLYAGRCQVQVPNVAEQSADAGERDWTVQAAIVKLPVTGSEDVEPGHTVTMTAATLDASLAGRRFTVRADHAKTFATARRLRCEEVTG